MRYAPVHGGCVGPEPRRNNALALLYARVLAATHGGMFSCTARRRLPPERCSLNRQSSKDYTAVKSSATTGIWTTDTVDVEPVHRG